MKCRFFARSARALLAAAITVFLAFSERNSRVPARDASEKSERRVVALIGADVITMECEEVLTNYTVVIADGKIAEMGPAAKEVPPNAVRIDARGKYVVPGFIDTFADVDDESNLILFVANGVTTVRNTAGGYARHLALRDRVARGELLGPRIFTTGGDITSPH